MQDINEMFASHPDPLSLFSFDGGHDNEKGYRLFAEAISEMLSADGFLH